MPQSLNFCFFASSNFGAWVLKTILKKYKPALVVTLPAKPAGRGLQLQPNIIYSLALKEKLPVIELQTTNYKLLTTSAFNFGLIAGFGRIIPVNTNLHESGHEFSRMKVDETVFEKGILNLHPSLLPKYRGSNPIREVILQGERKTGVTLFLIDEKVDHGPILAQEVLHLRGDEINEELEMKLGQLAGNLFNEAIEGYLKSELKLTAQNEAEATYTKKVLKEDGLLKVDEGYEIWDRKIRALNPWPSSFLALRVRKELKNCKIAKIARLDEKQLPPEIKKIKVGQFFQWRNELGLRLPDAFIAIKELQLEGKKRMNSKEFLNGYPLGSFRILL